MEEHIVSSPSTESPVPGDGASLSSMTLAGLMARRVLWRCQSQSVWGSGGVATGIAALDAVLPLRGWPASALSEVLLPAPGMLELQLLWPLLARLTQAGARVVLIAPPFVPCATAWQQAGVVLSRLEIVEADASGQAVWAFEQCLCSGSCAAVVGWPAIRGELTLRRLQVAAHHGQSLGVALRAACHAAEPSPAALRLQILSDGRLKVLKCRGGAVPGQCVSLPPAI